MLPPAEKLQNFFGVFLQFLIGVDKKRLEWLDEADAEKTLLLVLFGIAKNQKYITQKKLFELQGKLNEIGRIIGGLQKYFINNGNAPQAKK